MASAKFNKELFSKLLQLAQGDKKERSLNQYGYLCEVDPGLISRYINKKCGNPPTVQTIQKLASKAKNGITYSDLMKAAGYLDEDDNSTDNYVIHNLILVMESKSPEEFVSEINDPRISKDMIEYYLSGDIVPQAGTLFILAERLGIDYTFFYKNNTWNDYIKAKEEYINNVTTTDNTIPPPQTLSKEEWQIINKIRNHDLDTEHVKNILDILIAQKSN